jgi:hypothetical protein
MILTFFGHWWSNRAGGSVEKDTKHVLCVDDDEAILKSRVLRRPFKDEIQARSRLFKRTGDL